MLPNILSLLETWLEDEQVISKEHWRLLSDLLRNYKAGELIYPGVIVRKLSITAIDAYRILEVMKKHELVEPNYELYCHDCNRFTTDIYRSLDDMPEEFECECCGASLNSMENSIVIYRVLKDGSNS